MRINKRRFKRAIKIIISTILTIMLITIFSEDLKVNGLSSLFTQPGLRQAFKLNSTDLIIINTFEIISIILMLFVGYKNLEYKN